jgi:hypothetical protein
MCQVRALPDYVSNEVQMLDFWGNSMSLLRIRQNDNGERIDGFFAASHLATGSHSSAG